jgi:hypothetical protein
MLANAMLRDGRKKIVTPAARREATAYLHRVYR